MGDSISGRESIVVVREARREDLERLLDLYFELYIELCSRQGLRPHDKDEYREEVEQYLSRDKVFLAESDSGEAVGFNRISERDDGCWLE